MLENKLLLVPILVVFSSLIEGSHLPTVSDNDQWDVLSEPMLYELLSQIDANTLDDNLLNVDVANQVTDEDLAQAEALLVSLKLQKARAETAARLRELTETADWGQLKPYWYDVEESNHLDNSNGNSDYVEYYANDVNYDPISQLALMARKRASFGKIIPKKQPTFSFKLSTTANDKSKQEKEVASDGSNDAKKEPIRVVQRGQKEVAMLRPAVDTNDRSQSQSFQSQQSQVQTQTETTTANTNTVKANPAQTHPLASRNNNSNRLPAWPAELENLESTRDASFLDANDVLESELHRVLFGKKQE